MKMKGGKYVLTHVTEGDIELMFLRVYANTQGHGFFADEVHNLPEGPERSAALHERERELKKNIKWAIEGALQRTEES
jgi:hypothetical protein